MGEKLDLAFAMDCTASMGCYIASAKENIENIVQKISTSGISSIRFGLVEYRDHPPQDYSFVTRKHDFTSNISTIKSWLNTCFANGGGDTPEAVADALYDILNMSWRSDATKVCVLISDAPPHGLEHDDNFPQCPAKHDPVSITSEIAKKGIALYSVGCGLSGNDMDFFMALAFKTGGQYVPLTNAENLADVVIGSAQEEVSLEKWMAEIEEEIQKDFAAGKTIDEEELTRKIHEKMKIRGARAKQLKVKEQNKQVGDITRRAKRMSKLKTLAEMRDYPVNRFYLPSSNRSEASKYHTETGEITLEQTRRMVTKAKARIDDGCILL